MWDQKGAWYMRDFLRLGSRRLPSFCRLVPALGVGIRDESGMNQGSCRQVEIGCHEILLSICLAFYNCKRSNLWAGAVWVTQGMSDLKSRSFLVKHHILGWWFWSNVPDPTRMGMIQMDGTFADAFHNARNKMLVDILFWHILLTGSFRNPNLWLQRLP